jgi:YgiT-type zinc finger domain-containing protein
MIPGTATVTFQRSGTILVFKDVPADVCDNCGEEHLDEATTAQLLQEADQAARSAVDVEVRTYVAA